MNRTPTQAETCSTEPGEDSGTTFHLLIIIKQWKGQRTDRAIFPKVIKLELFTNPFRYKILV
jgi:hypothetical protein